MGDSLSSEQRHQSGIDYRKKAEQRKEVVDGWPAGCATPREAELVARYRSEGMSRAVVGRFQRLVLTHYREHGRTLPWRKAATPWQVLVSEVMLQQTQVERVIPKYLAFVERFPDAATLAAAPVAELLAAWQGLGYNRRALALQRAAAQVVTEFGGRLPDSPALLQTLPGIGPYTAGAVAAFAFNQPTVFLETNIRAVLLHLFFDDRGDVTDRELLPLAEATLDRREPRRWYNALMDYGSDLKTRFPNPSRRSRHHAVQSRFEGSDRQIRGAILRLLLAGPALTATALCDSLGTEPERLLPILEGLVREGFVARQRRTYRIA